MSTIIQQNNKVYDDYYRTGDIDGWEERDKRNNFFYLFKIEKYCNFPLENSSILDVGCGTSDILQYLPECKYLGIDIYKPALKLAKEKYPDYEFKYSNILTTRMLKKFDFIICSGALTVSHGNNYKFLQKAVNNMWRLCKKGVTFNILTGNKSKKDGYLYQYKLDDVKDICLNIINKGKYYSEHNPIDKFNDQNTIYLCKK